MPCVCVYLWACVFLLSTFEWMNQFYETWYEHHGTWTHLNGVLHKSLSINLYIRVSLSLLDNGSVKIVLSLLGNLNVVLYN
jgi:hypothetical protein